MFPHVKNTAYGLNPRKSRNKHYQIAQASLTAQQNFLTKAGQKQQHIMEKMKKPYNENVRLKALKRVQMGAVRMQNKKLAAEKANQARIQAQINKAAASITAKQKIVEAKKTALKKAEDQVTKVKEELDKAIRDLEEVKTKPKNNNSKNEKIKKEKADLSKRNEIIKAAKNQLEAGNLKNHLLYGTSNEANRKRKRLSYFILKKAYLEPKEIMQKDALNYLQNVKEPVYPKNHILKVRNDSYRKLLTLPLNNKTGKYKLPVKLYNNKGKFKTSGQIAKELRGLRNKVERNSSARAMSTNNQNKTTNVIKNTVKNANAVKNTVKNAVVKNAKRRGIGNGSNKKKKPIIAPEEDDNTTFELF